MRRFGYGLAILIALAVGACATTPDPGPEARAAADTLAKNIHTRYRLYAGESDARQPDTKLFARVFERVRADYVRPVDERVLLAAATGAVVDAEPPTGEAAGDWLVEQAIRGMLESLDPYSVYLPRDEYGAIQDSMRGRFGGLGIQISKSEEHDDIVVVTPLDNTPAAAAGLRPGDRITHVDGVKIGGLPLAEVVRRLRGPVDTSVVLTILRDDAPVFDRVITRAIIRMDVVEWRREDDFGYLRIRGFSDDTAEQVQDAVREIRSHLGGRLAGLVIDLRNNPGGLLIESVSVSDAFIERGDIVSTRGRNGLQRYGATMGDIAAGLPIAVLVNGGSASASEILAAALKDRGRAILVGTRTFGKGTVQTVIPMGNGTALKLTTARYFRPSGASVDNGIVPDIEVADVDEVEGDEALERAIAELSRLARL